MTPSILIAQSPVIKYYESGGTDPIIATSELPHLCRVWSKLTPAGVPVYEVLTVREREVLKWIAEGKRDSEIGIILAIASKTVSKHVENILRKLSVETRTGAASAYSYSLSDNKS